ncbi:MAG: bifunctional [glutamine synthetase] adenylyltransferase/[glutamine synthetase]-adenylyl-L-tyrosine phosphorylase [Pseudomonadota bacterium]
MHLPYLGGLTDLPKPADMERAERGRLAWHDAAVAAGLADHADAFDADPNGQALMAAVFGNSPYLSRSLERQPVLLTEWAEKGPDHIVDVALASLYDNRQERPEGMMSALRDARRNVAVAVALSDITGLWPLERITGALSDFAAAAIDGALASLLAQAAAAGKIGLTHPDDPTRDSGFIVLGMGKLGGGELNYSSDVDLIVLWDDERLQVAENEAPQAICVRLTRNLVKMLEERTADGYVLRTDLRLRPDPGATPLALSVDAAELYYESLGQNWERAALIKARPVAGDATAGNAFLDRLTPFIWRRHLDFAAIQDIHSIKRQIHAHKGGGQIAVAGHNVKLGRGGIREIEFFAQTQQLIFGGRDRRLRPRATCEALNALARATRIDRQTADDLIDAYGKLRRIEHRLQMIEDAQTHSLPESADALAGFATFLGYGSVDAFADDLTGILRRVESHYADLFEEAEPLSGGGDGDEAGNLVFTGNEDDPDTLATLTRMGFADAAAIAAVVRGWHHGRVRATRSRRAREILTELVPDLLNAFAGGVNPDAALMRFNEFLDHLPAGVQLFSLFQSNAGLLALVANIMGTAPRLAEHLARTPTLLDHVLSPDFFEALPDARTLEADATAELALAQDEEDLLDRIRRWTHDREFQLGVQLLLGKVTPGDAARSLSDLTDASLRALIPHVAEQFAGQHGMVPDGGMAVLALGKYGSRELNFGSDLDLVFIYGTRGDADASDGPKPLAASQYFIRLCQRMLNALTTMTNAGRLFEIDMRLRPSGSAGPLASEVSGFLRYHRDDAWTWEHLALTRSRIVLAPEWLAREINEGIRAKLMSPRDAPRLAHHIVDMRARIAGRHPPRDSFDIKFSDGGLIDLDFIAQFLVLRYADAHPSIIANNSVDVLERAVEAGLVDEGLARDLIAARQRMHEVQGILRLAMAQPTDEAEFPQALCDMLVRMTGEASFDALRQELENDQARVKETFEDLITNIAATEDSES